MDEPIRKSCWGITAWAVVGFACIMVIAYLAGMAGGPEIAIAAQ